MTKTMKLAITLNDPRAVMPKYAHEGDAGLDLFAVEDVNIPSRGGRAIVGTGISIALPDGYAAFVQSRSGLAAKHGIAVLNSPGLIDSGYRNEIKVILHNTDLEADFTVSAGDRIAQLVVQKVECAELIELVNFDELSHDEQFGAKADTARGLGGLGSTGV